MPTATKSGNTPRRISSSLSKVSTPPSTSTTTVPSRTNKSSSSKPSKIIPLKLPKNKLLQFPHGHLRKGSQAKASPLSSSKVITPDESGTDVTVKNEPSSIPALQGDKGSRSPTKDTKSEKSSTSKTGVKRELGAGVEGDDSDKLKGNARKRPKP